MHAQDIKYVGLCGTSTANIDLGEPKKRNIPFSNIVPHDKEAYKMHTCYFGPRRKRAREDLGVEYLAMPELLAKSETVVSRSFLSHC